MNFQEILFIKPGCNGVQHDRVSPDWLRSLLRLLGFQNSGRILTERTTMLTKIKSKRVAIIQSNYIPWKGYFDIINMVDEFILFDDMQYTRRDWRNRNQIKTAKGLEWLTIPVEVKGKYYQKINETRISEKQWAKKHWAMIRTNYSRARYFNQFKNIFEELYLGSNEEFLSKINHCFILAINSILGIETRISFSSEYNLIQGKSERLIDLCKQAGANEYISGPAAKGYIDEELFLREHIGLSWMNYDCYPEYEQLYPPFTHSVSIIDLIFNTGPEATKFMKSFNKQE